MSLRSPLLTVVMVCLTLGCSEEALLPPREVHPPPFEFSQYLENGKPRPDADVLLVRRPAHLEHVYELSLDSKKPGYQQAKDLFDNLEGQFRGAGVIVAEQVYSLRCAAVELPDCVPQWRFIDELLGPADGPGARRLRQVLADAFEQTAHRKGMENTLVLAVVNVVLAEGMLQSTLGKAATAEARAATVAEHRAMIEGPAVQARALGVGESRAAAVGAQQLAVEAGRLGLKAEVSAMEARLVEAEAQEVGARQPAAVKELARLRPSLERPLAGAETEAGLWRDYVSYWEQRYAELTSPAGVEAEVKPPLSWPGYRVFRTRFRRAMEFEAQVSLWLRAEQRMPVVERKVFGGMRQPLTDSHVGLKHEGRASVNYVDDMAVDATTLKGNAPRVETVSTKQRDFWRMSEDEAAEQVATDAKEALAKYGGEVEIRRPGHPLFERRVTVSRVHLVYDEALVPKGSDFRGRMLNKAREEGVELHFHHAP